jgi:pimeloyl-ACP methyl ester carboxylesterase
METRFLRRGSERIAYDLCGERGPLVICVPGMGDLRAEYRFLAPFLVAAGYRVATMDVRGHGESSTGWDDYSAAAVGADVVALIAELGGAAFILGTSMAGGAAVWAAAEAPASVAGVVLIGPFVRDIPINAFMRGMIKLLFAPPWGPAAWTRYYKSLYPSAPPQDFDEYRARLGKSLREPGRFAALRAMLGASKADCEARLPAVKAPALVVMGSRDPDFKDPLAEAKRVAGALRGEIYMADGAGHYPHAEKPAATATRIAAFLRAGTVDGHTAATAHG